MVRSGDEFYDLAEDPWEKHSFGQECSCREIRQDLRERLRTHADATGDVVRQCLFEIAVTDTSR